jgi:hypothetical protein
MELISKSDTDARIANPTIAVVLAQFLEEQRGDMSARTFARHRDAVELLQHCLNEYGPSSLDREEADVLDRLGDAKGIEHREFCEIFGPEHILPNVGEFLGWFMVRKVVVGKETLRAAGIMIKKLAVCLAEKGYVTSEWAEDAAERGTKAAKDLPDAEDLAFRLHAFAKDHARDSRKGDIEDHFTISRVESGKIWLKGVMSHDPDIGPIKLPEDISRGCRVGWDISGIIGRAGRGWRFIEVWNVYP